MPSDRTVFGLCLSLSVCWYTTGGLGMNQSPGPDKQALLLQQPHQHPRREPPLDLTQALEFLSTRLGTFVLLPPQVSSPRPMPGGASCQSGKTSHTAQPPCRVQSRGPKGPWGDPMKILLTILAVGTLTGECFLTCPQIPLPQQPRSTFASSCPKRLLTTSFVFFLAGT